MVFIWVLSQMHIHRKACVDCIDGVHMWFESNAYSWEILGGSYCFAVVRVGTSFSFDQKRTTGKCMYIENGFRFLYCGCLSYNMTGFLWWGGRPVL